MIGVHEDKVGDAFLRARYRRGSIVTGSGGVWGVVLEDNKYTHWHSYQVAVTWLVDGEWTPPTNAMSGDLSAPYVHTYEGIPEEVLAKATYYKLVS